MLIKDVIRILYIRADKRVGNSKKNSMPIKRFWGFFLKDFIRFLLIIVYYLNLQKIANFI